MPPDPQDNVEDQVAEAPHAQDPARVLESNSNQKKSLEALLCEACSHGYIDLSSRSPPLTATPLILLDWLQEEPPSWLTQEPSHANSVDWKDRKRISSLNFSQNHLASLDSWLGQFAGLTSLNLSMNQLTSLPTEVMQLPGLTTLNLAHNQFDCIPDLLLQHPHLTHLDVSHNLLDSLWSKQSLMNVDPSSILPRLTTLNVSHNQLRNNALMHANHGEVHVLALPHSLRTWNLSENQIQGPLPLQLFKSIGNLERLDVSGNEVGDTIFAPPRPMEAAAALLQHLRVLEVRRTGMSSLASLELLFNSAPAISLQEAMDPNRTPLSMPATQNTGVAPRLLIRAAKPLNEINEEPIWMDVTCENHIEKRKGLVIVCDASLARSSDSGRRKRGGRGRGGDHKREEHDESAISSAQGTDAGSALANAKLSSKKKEALGQVPCKFFRNHGCSAGDACPFAHTLPSEGQTKAVCQWYLKGSCRFGHRCALAHVLPGQPMSMDRKNKRAAQVGSKPDERHDASENSNSAENPLAYIAYAGGSGAGGNGGSETSNGQSTSFAAASSRGTPIGRPTGAVFIPSAARKSQPSNHRSPPLSSGQEAATWESTSSSLEANTVFGTSPFSYPGSHSLFFNTNRDADMQPTDFGTTPSYAPWTRKTPHTDAKSRGNPNETISTPPYDPLAGSSHAEDFLPSSLSDLLTPVELERRARNTRNSSISQGSNISQSLPSADNFSRQGRSPPSTGYSSRFSNRIDAQGMPAFPRMHGTTSYATLETTIEAPDGFSPPGTVRTRGWGSSFSSRPEDRRQRLGVPLVRQPSSPALPPARDDFDDTMFELES
ncbi:hypothetical protein MPSI1_002183 [Malassezia psittaci]|uniref:C3H1-type domain-containing protein n=1 Tax=Malassezia psittaci TaxID=1821823 RepID=A0AAF0F5M6_9BASI|nr:hypothetical protein MPSI1_002183 [Malassezia psittaci]